MGGYQDITRPSYHEIYPIWVSNCRQICEIHPEAFSEKVVVVRPRHSITIPCDPIDSKDVDCADVNITQHHYTM